MGPITADSRHTARHFQSLANVRSIRAMAMESTFQARFVDSRREAWATGVIAATANAASHGSSVSLPYFAQGELREQDQLRLALNPTTSSFAHLGQRGIHEQGVLHIRQRASDLLLGAVYGNLGSSDDGL